MNKFLYPVMAIALGATFQSMAHANCAENGVRIKTQGSLEKCLNGNWKSLQTICEIRKAQNGSATLFCSEKSMAINTEIPCGSYNKKGERIVMCGNAAVALKKGERGETGAPGEPGLQGEMGPMGPMGDKGARGPMGPEGAQGDKGPQGQKGEKGIKGAKGGVGLRGEKGPQGIAGPKGDLGVPGSVGPEGPEGPQGPQGPLGPQGAQGPQGNTTQCSGLPC
jgi:hypothetical protein